MFYKYVLLTFWHGYKLLNELFVLVLEPISCWEDMTPFNLFPITLGKWPQFSRNANILNLSKKLQPMWQKDLENSTSKV